MQLFFSPTAFDVAVSSPTRRLLQHSVSSLINSPRRPQSDIFLFQYMSAVGRASCLQNSSQMGMEILTLSADTGNKRLGDDHFGITVLLEYEYENRCLLTVHHSVT